MIFIKFMDQNRIKKTCLACIYMIFMQHYYGVDATRAASTST